ncbi:NADP-dependent 3-hydroxy acid dehydrogenase YdfG [Chitinophaga jiangningensis]|uniref:NADP-dependent 3-hydroxy acid dehydrogenase YdfG n=1 Tax=Chitinophaga jiangningensis TaxID=1419482 RepID=A0A1M7EDU4_9BACT|nr:SDR family oxidoreductase [Chitinophaga jiangningensis]SHL89893.1 NADP-dependent 3-hydroxy acid dehydrogenase YdfG [Chitinophaga jiangningensis]
MNAVITGASKGIGRAVAERLAKEGFNIAICARNAAALAEAKAAIQAQNSAVTVLAEQVDMGDKAQVLRFAETVKNAFGQVDILVNNAGIFTPGSLYEEAEGLLEQLMAVNLYSAYHLTRALLPEMMQLRKGHIFNLCSVASHKAYANGGSYSITKHALLGFSRNLREEMKPYGVRVTSISPGATLTASWDGFEAPPDRMMPPEDIATVVWTAFTLAKQTVVEDIVLRPVLGDI